MIGVWITFKLIFLLLVLSFHRYAVEAACQTPEDCLYRDLFADYNVKTRPALQPNNTVEVSLTLTLESLSSIDEKNEIMHMVGIVIGVWYDPRLQWTPSNYSGVTLISLQSTEVWLPDFALVNSAGSFFQKSHREDFFVLLTSDGLVRWSYGGIFSTTCSIDMSRYPLDQQTCPVEFYNWGYTKEYINIVPTGFLTDTYVENALWNLENTSAERLETPTANGETYIGVHFSVTWSRKQLYYQFNLILPIVLLLLVSLGILWIPPDVGERLSLAITVQLSYAVFLIVIMDNTPINSTALPVISRFVIVVMVTATAMLMESILNFILSNQTTRPPHWLRKLAFVYLAQLFCSKKEVQQLGGMEINNSVSPKEELISLENTNDGKKPQNDPQSEDISKLLKAVSAILHIMEEKEVEESYNNEWKMIGKLLDRLMFTICVFVLVIVICVIFLG